MRKQVSFALALSMVMTSGMATVANAAADDGKTNVVFWNSWTGGDGDTLEALVNKFNEESDTVHVEMTRTTSFSDMLQTSLPTGEAADLVLLSTNEITRYKSYLRSMDDIWENTGLKEEGFLTGIPEYVLQRRYTLCNTIPDQYIYDVLQQGSV